MSGPGPLVHLIDPCGPRGARWLAALAARHADGARVAIGPASAMACAHRVPVTSSRSATVRTLERLLQAMQPCAVVAWGARASEMAVEARDSAPRWLLLDGLPSLRSVPFDAEVACVSEAVADVVARSGWPPMRIRVLQPPAPVVTAADAEPMRRTELRRRWGAAEGSLVVGLLPAGDDEGDAMSALDVVGRAHLAGVDARLVLHPRTGGAAEMQVFARSAGLRERVRFEPDVADPSRLAAGVDVWLSLPDASSDGTSLHPAVAGGLGACLLAARASLAGSAIEHDIDGVVATDCNGLAARLVGLAESPGRLLEIGHAARARHATEGRIHAFRGLLSDIEASVGIRDWNRAAAST